MSQEVLVRVFHPTECFFSSTSCINKEFWIQSLRGRSENTKKRETQILGKTTLHSQGQLHLSRNSKLLKNLNFVKFCLDPLYLSSLKTTTLLQFYFLHMDLMVTCEETVS